MNVFIAWSGEASKGVAGALREWLPLMNPDFRPFVSTVDIAPGTRWDDALSDALDGAHCAILCVTPENAAAQWLNYEGGTLSQATKRNAPDGQPHVTPLLCGLSGAGQLRGPLSHFQSVVFGEDGVVKLLMSMDWLCKSLLFPEEIDGFPYDRDFEATVREGFPALEQAVTAALEAARTQNNTSGKDGGTVPTQNNSAAASDKGGGATENGAEASNGDKDGNAAFARRLQALYDNFGFHAEIPPVHYVGDRLVKALGDNNASFKMKADLMRQFEGVLNKTIEGIENDVTDINPDRQERLERLEELKRDVRNLS